MQLLREDHHLRAPRRSRELYDAARPSAGHGAIRTAWGIRSRPCALYGADLLRDRHVRLHRAEPVRQLLGVINSATPNLYAYNFSLVINRDLNSRAAAIIFVLGIVIMIVSYVVQVSAQRRAQETCPGDRDDPAHPRGPPRVRPAEPAAPRSRRRRAYSSDQPAAARC